MLASHRLSRTELPHAVHPMNWLRIRSSQCFFLAFCLIPSLTLAQAGSSSPVVAASAEAFSGSPAGRQDTQSGAPGLSTGASRGDVAMLPAGILKLPRDERFVLWVELEEGRLNVLEQQDDGGLITRKVVPISIGANGYGKELEGDKRTPVGVYRFTSFLDDERLGDFYGLGAYPLNYPNVLDRRLQRTGSGIWLHGLPKDVEERPRLDSDGCVIIDNTSLLEMAAYIESPDIKVDRSYTFRKSRWR
jgi:hypothetical protein